jgi:hypothetical protein
MHLTRGFHLVGTRLASFSSHQNTTSSYISSQNTRGTLDILFGSLSTILICALTLQRLNIPPPSPQATTWRQNFHQSLARIFKQTKYLLLTLICPELWIGKAFQDFMVARRSCREMKEFAEQDGVTWTLTHAYFANVGGFKFKVRGDPWLDDTLGSTYSRSTISLVSLERVYQTIREKNSSTMPNEKNARIDQNIEISETREKHIHDQKTRTPSTHSSVSGRQTINERVSVQELQETPPTSVSSSEVSTEHDASSVNTGRMDDNRSVEEHTTEELFDPYYIYPNADQIKTMREFGMIDLLPQISTREIGGMSNKSILAKTVAFIQISWFVLQITMRAAKHVPISQLEVATLAFVVCAILMYLLFWSIPQGITASIEINRDRPIRGHALHPFASNLLVLGGYCGFDAHFWPGQTIRPRLMLPPPNDVVLRDGPKITKNLHGLQQYPYVKIGIALAGTLFGVVHCLAWGFSFPTSVDRIVWRVASIYISLAFVSWPISFILTSIFAPEGLGDRLFWAMWSLTLIGNVIYAVARLALLVLVFRGLFYLPAGSFVSTWADKIPHFS